ncbi:MAG TPA: NADH:ubiquinone reductase (Na(+)-transporting) subunit A [Bacteroidetes bacterium]|nr:NADH:ubiquinone reductase (Na(+)-transporting) subunit A [Bacteroidota bacterium]
MFLNRPSPMKRTLRNILTLVLFNLVATPMFAADDSVSNVIVFSSLAFVIVLLIFLALIMGDQSIRISRSTLAKDEQDLPPSFIPSKKEIFGINDDPIAGDAKVHVLDRGHEIKLDGRADVTLQHPEIKLVSVRPTDYVGMQPIPKMLVAEGDSVKIGQKLFHDRKRDSFFFTSPVAGKVKEIRRGAKRAITDVIIEVSKRNSYVDFGSGNPKSMDREGVVEKLIESGLWVNFIERPFGIVPNRSTQPDAIYISTFDTAPLAPDYNQILAWQGKEGRAHFQKGLDALNVLAPEQVHLGLNAGEQPHAAFTEAKNATKHWFKGIHPAGNPGVQLHHVRPIGPNDKVWTLRPDDVIMIGRLFETGKLHAKRIVALTGDCLSDKAYIEVPSGSSIGDLVKDRFDSYMATDDRDAEEKSEISYRMVSGNVLSGLQIEGEGFLRNADAHVTVLEEGDKHEMFGWLLPSYPRPSINPTIPWSLFSFMTFKANTNTHGERRAFVVSGQYESVMPMDLYPQHLLKSILAEDFESIEGLGIYEVLEEDLALCEFVCTSKQPVQETLRQGLNFIMSQR